MDQFNDNVLNEPFVLLLIAGFNALYLGVYDQDGLNGINLQLI